MFKIGNDEITLVMLFRLNKMTEEQRQWLFFYQFSVSFQSSFSSSSFIIS